MLALSIGILFVFQFVAPVYARQDVRSPGQASMAEGWITPEIQISFSTNPESDHRGGRVAYNSQQDEYLVVWFNQWEGPNITYDIYAYRVDSTGELLTWFCVATGASGDQLDRSYPALAYNAAWGEYLVVYMVEVSGAPAESEVWGRRVAWDGSWLGPEFLIFKWANRDFKYPRVAWNSDRNEYLVVANALATDTNSYNDVAGRRVTADGNTLWPGHSISSQNQFLQPHDADVVYNPGSQEYLVVWLRYFNNFDWDIWGARVRGDNDQVVTPPGEFPIDASLNSQEDLGVATNQVDRYLVVWREYEPQTPSDIMGKELSNTGSAIGSSFSIAASNNSYGSPSVVIDKDSNLRFVVYLRYNVPGQYELWGIGWKPPTVPTNHNPIRITTNVFYSYPVIAGGSTYLTVYGKLLPREHIFGSLYWPEVIFLPFAVR